MPNTNISRFAGPISTNNILDAAGRQEVSENIATGEYTLDKNNLPLYFNQENGGTGSQAYNATINSQTLSVTTTDDFSIFQTRQFHPYFPGHPQQPEFTFIGFQPQTNVIKRVGYFSSATTGSFDTSFDGFYLESSGGSVSFNVAQEGTIATQDITTWKDPLDGTGPSGLTVDWNNFQVFQMDFLYLGGAIVNLYWIVDGWKFLIHQYKHANLFADVIMGTPAQPLRAEVRSTGGAGSFSFTCGQVSTAGGSADFAGIPFAHDTDGLVSFAASGTEYVALAMRKTNRAVEVFPQSVTVASTDGAAEAYIWRLHLNPSLSGAISYSTTNSNAFLEFHTGDGSITVSTPGYVIDGDIGVSRGANAIRAIATNLRIGATIAGVYDQLVLTYTPLAANQNAAAKISGFVV